MQLVKKVGAAWLVSGLLVGAVALFGADKAARDRFTYTPVDGPAIELSPADPAFKPVNQPVEGATIYRGGGRSGEWIVPKAATQPATLPATVPVVVVPPVVIPPLPPVVLGPPAPVPALIRTLKAVEVAGRRGDGVTMRPGTTLKDRRVIGYEQNVVAQDEEPGRYTLRNVRSVDSTPAAGGVNVGQAYYFGVGTTVDAAELFGARAGWRLGMAPKAKTDRRHTFYGNEGTDVTLSDFVFTEASACGAQLRGVSRIKRGFVHRSAIGLLLLYGPHKIDDLVIYGGGWTFDGTNFTNDSGLDLYCPVELTNVQIVGDPDQPPPPTVAKAKTYSMGAITGHLTHGQFPDTPGCKGPADIKASNVTVYGWHPQSNTGGCAFGGTLAPQIKKNGKATGKFADLSIPGVTVVKGPGVRVDVAPTLAAIEAGTLGVAEGSAKLRAMVRAALPK
ncbi:MAG: hypothetical protein JWO31_724 [Phycisphaerales bacterium]|nr:hypothetical protein [Phycisphaerales bacterium]